MHRFGVVHIQLIHRDKLHPAFRIGREYAVDDADMKVRVRVERGAEAMDEGHRAGPGIRPGTRAVRTQMAFDLIEEDAQSGIEGLTVMLKVVAQPLW